ncbi:MAG: response regulator transcription factor [Chitinophagaceae bacterium]|nr:MAG: response regulator transcription factor [Chitinophagaceae bacterium]
MEKISCLIVEDEPLAAEILQDYISQVPFLELKASCRDALFALEVLQRQAIELMFLDIHLPNLRGLDFVRTLKNPPQVIFTTAYRDYAIEGYELNAVDYLLKPIHFNRFLMAVNKVRERQRTDAAVPGTGHSTGDRAHLLINVNKKRVRVYYDEILYFESKKEYIKIVTTKTSYLSKYQISEVENLVDKRAFLRLHRSFIVARDRITAFSATEVEVNGETIPIGRSYKELVMSVLGRPI